MWRLSSESAGFDKQAPLQTMRAVIEMFRPCPSRRRPLNNNPIRIFIILRQFGDNGLYESVVSVCHFIVSFEYLRVVVTLLLMAFNTIMLVSNDVLCLERGCYKKNHVLVSFTKA